MNNLDPTQPCDTCAFGKSGGAADEAANRLKAQICAHAGMPFFCHHMRSGPQYNWSATDGLGPLALVLNERRICAGWKQAVRNIVSPDGVLGFLREERPSDAAILRRYQRDLGARALGALQRFLGEEDPVIKEAARMALEHHCRALFGAEDRRDICRNL